MKNVFTPLRLLLVAVLPIMLFACREGLKNSKSYSASVAAGENVKVFPQTDLKFLYEAYSLEHYNLQLANEAKYRSTATESVQLADAVIKEAQQLKGKLSEVALEYELQLHNDMNLEQKDYWKELVKQGGWDFDKKFASTIGYNLKYARALYSQAIESITNEQLKKIASDALTELENQGNLALLQQEKIQQRTTDGNVNEDELVLKNKKKKRITNRVTQTIGIIAGIFTATSLLPQLIKILKEKKAEDVSALMLLVLMTGVGLWIYYGILREDLPIIITNSFSLLLNMVTLFYRIKYK